MLLSIITINKNNGSGLKKTIESVISQTYTGAEYIVIDGNSNDDSKKIIESFKNKINFSLSEEDSGIYEAQNKGIAKARGKYLLFLNSGDVLANENILQTITPLLKEKSFYYGDLILQKEGKQETHSAPKKMDLDFGARAARASIAGFAKLNSSRLRALSRVFFPIVRAIPLRFC